MPARRSVANSCSRNCTGMSRRRASSPIGTGPAAPVRPSSASARSAYGLFEVIEITARRLRLLAVLVCVEDRVGLAVKRGPLVGFELRGERVPQRVGTAAAVRRVLLKLALGDLEALGLALAGLVGRLEGRVVRVVQARAADRGRFGRGGGLLLGDE